MTTSKTYKIENTFYFFTLTCKNWLNLFEITNFYDEIYNWFDILKSQNIFTSAYVIMPDHLHSVIYNSIEEKSIRKILGTGRRFMSYKLVDILIAQNGLEILDILSKNVKPCDKRKGKLHEVFEQSMDIKILKTEKFIKQKINYIHLNPVSKKWKLIDDFRNYPHSSAGYYYGTDKNRYDVIHYNSIK